MMALGETDAKNNAKLCQSVLPMFLLEVLVSGLIFVFDPCLFLFII